MDQQAARKRARTPTPAVDDGKADDVNSRIEYGLRHARVTLLVPLGDGDESVTHLTIRRPTVNDQLNAQKMAALPGAKGNDGQVQAEIRMIANLTELTPEEVGDLDLIDYVTVQTALKGFLDPRSLKTS